VFDFGEVEVLPSGAAENIEHVQTGRFKMGRRVVRLTDKQLRLHAVIGWLKEVRQLKKSMKTLRRCIKVVRSGGSACKKIG